MNVFRRSNSKWGDAISLRECDYGCCPDLRTSREKSWENSRKGGQGPGTVGTAAAGLTSDIHGRGQCRDCCYRIAGTILGQQ